MSIMIASSVKAQENVYVAPDVSIYESAEQPFELPGSGDYIPSEEFRKYNFENINEILKRTPGVYVREEGGFGLFPNISIRGVDSLRSGKINLLEDGINVAPAPYTEPAAYFSPIASKMHAIETISGMGAYRYGPHSTGGSLNYVTTPVTFGTNGYAKASYGSFSDKSTHGYYNYGLTGDFGSFAILGEMYYRENDGFRDFNKSPSGGGTGRGSFATGYDSDDAGGLEQFSPMIKMLWQLPSLPITFELKGNHVALDYNEGYAGLTTTDFNNDPYQRYVGSQLDSMNSNGYQYYAKMHVDFSANTQNTTTAYYNQFTRDWYKLDKVAGISMSKAVSKAYNGTADSVLKGELAGTLKYKSNNRAYYAYGLQNETNTKFSHSFSNILGAGSSQMEHALRFGFKVHKDKSERDQYTDQYTQAVGGGLSGGTHAFNETRGSHTIGAAIYFEDRAKLGKLSINLGSRVEAMEQYHRKNSSTKREEFTFAWAPGGSVSYDYNENLSYFVGVYKGFGMPGSSSSTGSNLNPEKSLQKELGVRYKDSDMQASLVGFHTNLDDMIVLANTNATTSGDPDNAGSVVSMGVELQGSYIPKNWVEKGDLELYAMATYTDATLDGDSTSTDDESAFYGGKDGAMMPYIPEYTLGLGANYSLNKWDFGVDSTYTPAMYATALNTASEMDDAGAANAQHGKTDDHFIVNVSAAYQYNNSVSLSAGIKNALDIDYVASRHPTGARSGTPLAAWLRIESTF
jgi:Fe(3+) dicitrate transport protein